MALGTQSDDPQSFRSNGLREGVHQDACTRRSTGKEIPAQAPGADGFLSPPPAHRHAQRIPSPAHQYASTHATGAFRARNQPWSGRFAKCSHHECTSFCTVFKPTPALFPPLLFSSAYHLLLTILRRSPERRWPHRARPARVRRSGVPWSSSRRRVTSCATR